MDSVEIIAAAVLYEGYVLWPYRRSTRKNQQRWTMGGVYPRGHSQACNNSDPYLMQTQCLLTGNSPKVRVKVRFLHVVERQVARHNADATRDFVDELQVGQMRHLAWEEATEREIVIDDIEPAALKTPRHVDIDIPAGSAEEVLRDENGKVVGALVRSWQALRALVEIEGEALEESGFRLTVRVTNGTAWNGEDRKGTLQKTLVAAHTILTVEDGEFISLMDVPDSFKAAAEVCENIKTWPVLAGEIGEKNTLLSSPIILYDYPQIAPESSGDFYDGAEIDQLLLLNVLTLTDAEKDEMRATDPRAKAILERSEALNAEDFMKLHGAIREFRVLQQDDKTDICEIKDTMNAELPDIFANPFEEMDKAPPQSVTIGGVEIGKGSRVVLRPRAGGDIMDVVLAGKIAVIEAIDQDYDDRIHLSVTIEDDPGQEFGRERVLGHRFFFLPEEVEPLEPTT